LPILIPIFFFVFSGAAPEVGTTSLPYDFAKELQGSGLFSHIHICGMLLNEAVVARHLPKVMAGEKSYIKTFMGPTHQIRRSYTIGELRCVEEVLKYEPGIVPPHFRKMYRRYGLAQHFELAHVVEPVAETDEESE